MCLILGFTFFGPRGARYSASAIADFVGQSSISDIASIIGLIVLMAYLSETYLGASPQGRIAWGMSLLAAASFMIGWSLYFAISTSIISGGPPSILLSGTRS